MYTYQHNNIKQYCNNCGKYGHNNKNCKEPITSLGIICVKIDYCDDDNSLGIMHQFSKERNVNILKHNTKGNKHLGRIENYKDRVRFLLIQRKHSLGFLEFMRGRYDPTDYKDVIRLFELMSEGEISSLGDCEFDTLWTKVWRKTAHLKLYEEEYNNSKHKFLLLKNANSDDKNGILPLSFYVENITSTKIQPTYPFL